MKRILLLEDDKALNRGISLKLEKEGYEVLSAFSLKEAKALFQKGSIDLVISDITLSDGSGMDFCREVRQKSEVFIIFLTALDQEVDIVNGYDCGADDYMTKPVDEEEMILRIRALLRRAQIVNERRITIADVCLDYDSLTVSRGDESQTLPRKEFYLLYKLLSYPGKIFTRIQLMDEIWGMESQSDDNTINVHINRLRKRFEDYPEFTIETIRGLGYKAVKHL